MWAYTLSVREVEFTEQAILALQGVEWSHSLLQNLQKRGGISTRNMSLMFEVRVAYSLHRLGFTPNYEYSTGVGDKKADFLVKSASEWLIEVVSLGTSEAVKTATKEMDGISELVLRSTAENRRQSEEGEIIKAAERIAEKAKFARPLNAIHVILADMRGYLGNGGDANDYREMAYGPAAIPVQCRHFWDEEAILGLFDKSNARPLPTLVRERVHFLGFIRERRYEKGELEQVGYYLHNPHLFGTENEAIQVFESFPLRLR